MSVDKDDDPLMKLFSTRGGSQGRTPEKNKLLTNSSSNGAGNNGAGSPNNESLPTKIGSSAVTDARDNDDQSPRLATTASSIPGMGGGKNELSAMANLVLREARRELGSELTQTGERAVISEDVIADAVDRVLKKKGDQSLDDLERANIIIHLQKDLLGWGVLQPLIDNPEVTDIHVYDYRTVVLQRGKVSESTGLYWPSKAAYSSFLDRILLRLGKSLSTSQHTVDASFPNGIRLCAIHESVCGSRGPLLSIRVPRISEARLDNIVTYQVAPQPVVDYLAALIKSCRITMMIAGETGTGKTTLLRCLGTQFGPEESIVAVEDTPELNFQHPYFRSLVSRPPNVEGQGEVTLQEHIKSTLRMTPTRVILGEMRTPQAAEAFLESAQSGHVGISTIHARNARETLTRLESLLGRAQNAAAIEIIRQQIALAVDAVVWLYREKGSGKPRIGEVIEVGHYVEGTIQIRPMFRYMPDGDRPVWRLESWTSFHEEMLQQYGIRLADFPQECSFSSTGVRGRQGR